MNIPDEYKTGNAKMDAAIAAGMLKQQTEKYIAGYVTREVKPKQNKYSNTKTDVDGITFHSKKEAEHYSELKLEEKAGTVSDIELQPIFVLQEEFTTRSGEIYKPIIYRADFRYKRYKGKWFIGYVVEDVKGMRTELYKLKKKLLLYKYPDIIFREI